MRRTVGRNVRFLIFLVLVIEVGKNFNQNVYFSLRNDNIVVLERIFIVLCRYLSSVASLIKKTGPPLYFPIYKSLHFCLYQDSCIEYQRYIKVC